MDSLLSASATEIAEMILSRRVSSVEVVTANLERIKTVNPDLNAVVQLCEERALSEAAACDTELLQGKTRGLLHGVPFTLKDSHDTEGVISTGGTTGRSEFIPDVDSPPTARLRAAGGVLLGKTNTPELTVGGVTDNLIYGQTNNPYDLLRTPGGSSGGAAAIVAAGGSPLDLGSDTGGSIRGPANYCGIAGLKPTSGRVPRTGHIVPPGGLRDAFTTIGPLTRRVEDLSLIFPLITGSDMRDPYIVDMPILDPTDVILSEMRVATYDDNGTLTPTPEVMAGVKTASEALRDSGAAVSDDRPAVMVQMSELLDETRTSDGGAYSRVLLELHGTTRVGPILESRIAGSGGALDADEMAHVQDEMDRFRTEMLTFMDGYDAIICPVSGFPAPLHENAQSTTVGGYTLVYNMTGWPVVVVRVGTSPEGLPIGVQVVARPWREDVALALASSIEASTGGWKAPSL